MSSLDAIIARAKKPGAFVERRRFTLSRAEAVEKLRAATLRRPGQYVLELIQAAVLAGATYVAVDATDARVVVAWVGAPPISDSDLEHLLDHLFTAATRPGRRHLVQLAVATNALIRDAPPVLRIETGDGTVEGTRGLDLSQGTEGVLFQPEDALAGTYLVVERRRPWWRRLLSSGITAEQVLIEEQCRHTPVPILLNGGAPFGYKASRSLRLFRQGDEQSFDEGPGGRRGSLFLTAGESRIDLVVAGVRITTVALPELGVVGGLTLDTPDARGVCGVICDDALRKTADQGDIVRDERFEALLTAVAPHAAALCQRADPSFVPPRLAVSTRPDTHELPDVVPQLAPRAGVPRSRLEAQPHLPFLWVTPTDERLLADAADPAQLPLPVAVVSAAVAALLAEHLGRGAVRLTSAADCELARRMTTDAAGLTPIGPAAIDPSGTRWQNLVRADGTGLGIVEAGHVAIVERHGSTTVAVHSHPVGADGWLILCERPEAGVVSLEATWDGVERHAAPALAAHLDRLPPALASTVASMWLRWEPGGPRGAQLRARPAWSTPLPEALERFCRCVDEDTLWHGTLDERTWLDKLDQRAGPGHLPTPDVPEAVVWWDGQAWIAGHPPEHARAWAAVSNDGRCPASLPDWPRGPAPDRLVHTGAPDVDAVPWTEAWNALLDSLPASTAIPSTSRRVRAALSNAPRRGRLASARQRPSALSLAELVHCGHLADTVPHPACATASRPSDWIAVHPVERSTLQGWIGLPPPGVEIRPEVVVDNGLELIAITAPTAHPCAGYLRTENTLSDAVLNDLAASLWVHLNGSEAARRHPWTEAAVNSARSESRLHAQLRGDQKPPRQAARGQLPDAHPFVVAGRPLDPALIELERSRLAHVHHPERFPEAQRVLLAKLLG